MKTPRNFSQNLRLHHRPRHTRSPRRSLSDTGAWYSIWSCYSKQLDLLLSSPLLNTSDDYIHLIPHIIRVDSEPVVLGNVGWRRDRLRPENGHHFSYYTLPQHGRWRRPWQEFSCDSHSGQRRGWKLGVGISGEEECWSSYCVRCLSSYLKMVRYVQ